MKPEEEHIEKKKIEIPKPVTAGEVLEVDIEFQGAHNDGIAKKDGFVIFIKGATKGERCKVKITEVKRTYALGEKNK